MRFVSEGGMLSCDFSHLDKHLARTDRDCIGSVLKISEEQVGCMAISTAVEAKKETVVSDHKDTLKHLVKKRH